MANSRARFALWGTILKLAWPLIVANSFWNLQLTIDRIFLGRYATEALGAAIAVMGVFWTPMALLQQTAAYLTTFVAQYFGAKENKNIGAAMWQAIYLSWIGGLLFLGLIPLAEPGFALIGHAPAMTAMEIDYFRALCHSALPTALVAVASSFFSGLGQTRRVMEINAIGLVGNVILDYCMIFGHFGFPELGVAGAGYATAAATWCSAIYAGILVFQQQHERDFAVRSAWHLNLDLLRRYLRYGVPSGLQWALEGLAFTVVMILIGRMQQGEAALAASGIAATIMMIAALPTMGVAQAVTIALGQYLGEGQPELARRQVWGGVQLGLIYVTVMGLSFVLIPHFYLSWFENAANEALWQEVSAIAVRLLWFIAVFVGFDSMNIMFSFALKGSGDTRFVSLVALVVPWPLMVLPTWLMEEWPGAVYWAWAAASVFIICQAVIFLQRFRGGKWQTMSVIH